MLNDPLGKLLETQKIPHALLVVDGEKRVLEFARTLVGATAEHHPDLHLIKPEGKTHTIERMRQLSTDASLSSYQSPYKVFLIYEAEKMLPTSSNALLKTVEEPTDGTVIILLTNYREQILPTILSRCQSYSYHESVHAFEAKEAVVAAMQGDLSRLDEIEKALESGHDALLELTLQLARDSILLKAKLPNRLLFFPDAKPLNVRSLTEFEKKVREAKLGFERSVKKSAVLHYLFTA